MLKALAIGCVAAALGSCSSEAPPPPAPQVSEGEQLFSKICSECHPRRGRGNYIENIPATVLERRSEAELVLWIKGRNLHREMPSFVGLTDEQLKELAVYLLSQRAQSH